jgi:hypothetical protein
MNKIINTNNPDEKEHGLTLSIVQAHFLYDGTGSVTLVHFNCTFIFLPAFYMTTPLSAHNFILQKCP